MRRYDPARVTPNPDPIPKIKTLITSYSDPTSICNFKKQGNIWPETWVNSLQLSFNIILSKIIVI